MSKCIPPATQRGLDAIGAAIEAANPQVKDALLLALITRQLAMSMIRTSALGSMLLPSGQRTLDHMLAILKKTPPEIDE